MFDANKTQPKILVVDDEKLMLACVDAILEAYDYECILSSSGREALNILKNDPVDIVLLDLMMPEMNGYQVMEIIRDLYPTIDIIIISGNATFDRATQALRQGAKDFLAKPYKPDDLIKSIRHLEKTRHLERMVENMHEQVKQSEQRYRFFINNSPDIIFMLDQKGKFTFINQRVQDILGYEPDDLVGKSIEKIVSSGDRPQLQYVLKQIIQNPKHKQTIETSLNNLSNSEQFHFDLDIIAISQIYSDLSADQTQDIKQLANHNNKSGPEQILTGIYGVARDITQKKQYEQKLSNQLYYDNITQLPNRLLFIDRLNNHIPQAQRLEQPFAIIYLDINRFRKINDSIGRKQGDIFLNNFAKNLSSCLRSSDTLARVSADSFLILLPIYHNKTDIEHLIAKIQQKFTAPVIINNEDIYVDFSCGIACYPEHGEHSDMLIKHAEMAMYHSKSNQPGNCQFFSNTLVNQFQSSLGIENGIRKAISNNEFEVYFQPQINIQTNKLSGVEALIRWNHPEKGLISPDNFIPVAEESQLICDIGHWMIENSMKIFKQWNHNPRFKDLRLAINISANQFSQDDFCDRILSSIEKYQLKGRQIELEITENVVLDNVDQVVDKLNLLGQHGIQFAVDDFGMGYSSLSYLQKLPLNNLKIDRAFISPIQDATDTNSIITAIVSMAKEMDMEIVVEGVENEIQLNYVQNLGCPIVQGYYFAKPMSETQTRQFAMEMFH